MAAPVWVLSVNLETKTAAFTSGLSDAARNARSSFQDISAGAGEMGGRVGKAGLDVRHALGLVDNTIRGAHSMAMVDMIRMFKDCSLVMTALPFAMTAAGFALIAEIVVKGVQAYEAYKQELEKVKDGQVQIGTTANDALNSLNKRLIEAEKTADDLANDHLGAVQKELELINMESLDTLSKTFSDIEKQADEFFGHLKNSWYQFGGDATGAQHALQEFNVQYQNLLSSGQKDAASGLLHGTLEQAKQILSLQQQFSQGYKSSDLMDIAANRDLLRQAGGSGGYSEKEIQAQKALVAVLQAQADAEAKVAAIKAQESKNTVQQDNNETASRQAAAARESAEAMTRMGQESIQADKATADASLEIHRASLEERLASDIEFAGRERDLAVAANAAQVAALDKSGKDYQNQLKALQDKNLEIQTDYTSKVAELTARASVEIYDRDLTALQQSEREKIEATQEGSAARIAAIDAGIKEEQSRNLQETEFYRDLLNQRVQSVRQEAEEENKLKEDAAKEDADNSEKMAELSLAALKQRTELEDSARRTTIAQKIAQDTEAADQDYKIKMAALEREVQGLDKTGKDYLNKLKELQDKEKQLTLQHENEVTAIVEKAEEERNQRILAARTLFDESIAQGLTKSIMGHETWSRMLISLGDQVVSGMIENAIKSMLADDMTKEKDAANAARQAFKAGMHLPFPANLVAAPVLAAGAFAAVMAYETGTDAVPGIGHGDVVPALLSPGEGIVPGGVMDGLRNIARNGGFQTQPTVHLHVSTTNHVNTIDGDGMQAALDKNADVVHQHVQNSLRKMNR